MQLPDESVHYGYKILHLGDIDSTNDYAWKYLSKNNPTDKVAIIADHQYAGRGQYDRTWSSEPGKNVAMSVIMALREFSLHKAFHLNILVSISIIRAIENLCDVRPKVKWPNDIYYNNNKLGGILIKNKVSRSMIEHSVIGIGLNVNQANFDSSIPNAISLIQINKSELRLEELREGILTQLDFAFTEYYKRGIGESYNSYLDHLFAKEEFRDYTLKRKRYRLAIMNVDPEGALRMKSEDGDIYMVNGDLEYIFD